MQTDNKDWVSLVSCCSTFVPIFPCLQVAIAFWNAIGGDEDEIGDLDSDS